MSESGTDKGWNRTKDKGQRTKDKGQMIAIWTKSGIAKDERRTKDNYLDEVRNSQG
jgi:hypothetical protein